MPCVQLPVDADKHGKKKLSTVNVIFDTAQMNTTAPLPPNNNKHRPNSLDDV